jgi:hypothetical protein
MGSRPPSRTTARGTRPPSPSPAQRLLPALLAVAVATLLLAGCSDLDFADADAAARCDRLLPGTTYSADLDNDGAREALRIAGARLTITDGDLVYHSREKWHIVDSSLGDVDGDGYLEVVTLVDDVEGRHIGLWAYFGGEYRERIVTSELATRPDALRVCNMEHPGDYGDVIPAAPNEDLIVLTGTPGDVTGGPPTFLRWNGFGFVEVPPRQ